MFFAFNFAGVIKRSSMFYLIEKIAALRKKRTEDARDDHITEDSEEKSITEDLKEDPITDEPKAHPITEEPK